MNKLLYYFITIFRLSYRSLFIFSIFKAKLKFGFIKRRVKQKSYGNSLHIFKVEPYNFTGEYQDHFFNSKIIFQANELKSGKLHLFKSSLFVEGSPPDWFAFPEHKSTKYWYETPINEIAGHDIKLTWERSRFNWMVDLAFAYKVSGNREWIDLASTWFENWLDNNPYNCSVNWVCGQECAIRTLNLLLFLDQTKMIVSSQMLDFMKMNVERISLTLDYAIAQDNNHAITESAAIYVISSILAKNEQVSTDDKIKYLKLASKGKKTLIERVNTLTLNDGGFAMYSTNYHRVVLSVLSLVEYFCRRYSLDCFDNNHLENCKRLTLFLYELVDRKSGNVINMGANDGSLLYFPQLTEYRDFRPTLQVAGYFFTKQLFFDDKESCTSLYLLGEELDSLDYVIEDNVSNYKDYSSSGITKYSILKNVSLFIKYPVYDYRPSHSDLFHIDLWINGKNYLRDLGSYSYNDDNDVSSNLASIKSHNTVCVDNLEAMPRLGRFLLGCWPKTIKKRVSATKWKGEYKSIFGYKHRREVKIEDNIIYIIDDISNVKDSVLLNFNLPFEAWDLSEYGIANEVMSIKVSSSNIVDCSLNDAVESIHYNQLSKISRFSVKVSPTKMTVKVQTKIIIERH
ncbi:heparinase II/III family protein [Vibrio lentus]|uniref:heparinase II/III domain-containing protein n=1 Tax=Vibrio lentus TaxID=136468 RepID=UPI000CAF8BE0|nr:heparinase II/III family protein [Vibrio lentus]PMI85448.1 hypothetical protein BCU36_00820 [Vibrio lentus]